MSRLFADPDPRPRLSRPAVVLDQQEPLSRLFADPDPRPRLSRPAPRSVWAASLHALLLRRASWPFLPASWLSWRASSSCAFSLCSVQGMSRELRRSFDPPAVSSPAFWSTFWSASSPRVFWWSAAQRMWRHPHSLVLRSPAVSSPASWLSWRASSSPAFSSCAAQRMWWLRRSFDPAAVSSPASWSASSSRAFLTDVGLSRLGVRQLEGLFLPYCPFIDG